MEINNNSNGSRWKNNEKKRIEGNGILIRRGIDWENGKPIKKISKNNGKEYYSFPLIMTEDKDLSSYNPSKLITLSFWKSPIFEKISNLNLEYVESARSVIAEGFLNSIERNGKVYEAMIVDNIEIYGDENLKESDNDNDDIFI